MVLPLSLNLVSVRLQQTLFSESEPKCNNEKQKGLFSPFFQLVFEVFLTWAFYRFNQKKYLPEWQHYLVTLFYY